MKMFFFIRNIVLAMLFLLSTSFSTTVFADDETTARKTLKVCADPNYMPFSNKEEKGYENKIAALIGKKLELPVAYTWFPQRMGFIRNTLKQKDEGGNEYLCDLVMGVPKEFDFAKATIPYMRTTYAVVTLKDGKLKDLNEGNNLVTLPPNQLSDLRIGITERSPGALWLSRFALYEQMAPYIAQSGDPGEFPNEPMYKDLIAGNIDAAIVWGPTAAYFASLSPDKVKVLNLNSMPGVRFDFSISTAVRYGDDKWKNTIETVLKNNEDEINTILTEAGITLLENNYTVEKDDDDKSSKASLTSSDKKNPKASSTTTAVKTGFDPENSYNEHVRCEDDKKCKIDKFLLKGFRAFSQCQVCHGIDGNGSTIAPSLLAKLNKDITYDVFVDRVTNGFKGQMGVMPPWKENPNVMKKMNNLYAYLKARADGVIPAGRLKKFKK